VPAADGEHIDRLIAGLAAGQHGVVERAQLLRLGLSDRAIEHRLAICRLYRIHRGVYAVVPLSLLPRKGRLLAAALACGEGALISLRCGGALIGLRNAPAGPIDVTIPRRGSPKHAGVRVHSSRSLDETDRAEVDGIPCTSWARTIVDLAAIETQNAMIKLIERSLVLQIFDAVALGAQMDRASGKKGIGSLRRVLDDLIDDPPNTSSDFERDLLFLIAEYGLIRPVVNGWVCGYQVDFHWPDAKLVVEADDRATHATPIAFERDRARDLTLELAGWHVLRISARQLRLEPDRAAAAIAAQLGLISLDDRRPSGATT
jgi:very-short-patch-repair endonuclease